MSTADLTSVVLAAIAVALWIPPSPRRTLARRDVGRSRPALLAPTGNALRRGPGAIAAVERARDRVRAAWQSRGQVARRRVLTVELCTAFGAELRAGAMPTDAVARAVASLPGLCDEVGRVAALGGDVVPVLRAAAARPGMEGLAHLVAAWSVTELTGSGLARGCDRVVAMLRDEQALRQEVTAQLAGARATARLLGVLPLFGLVLGAGIGGRPWEFLLGTPYGLSCLGAGLALVALGLWWTERLVRSVEAQI